MDLHTKTAIFHYQISKVLQPRSVTCIKHHISDVYLGMSPIKMVHPILKHALAKVAKWW